VSEPQSSEIRVGDAEREEALRALGDHMSAGRLDINEYGDRTAQVAASKTRGELAALFNDLPEPRPKFAPPAKLPPPQAPAMPPTAAAQRWKRRPLGQRLYSALVPLSFILAAGLFIFVTKSLWIVFLIPVAITVIGGSLFGDDWSHDRRAYQREERHRRRRHWDDRH
jgi:hypothetical protein